MKKVGKIAHKDAVGETGEGRYVPIDLSVCP
jgi:hypothetical protein